MRVKRLLLVAEKELGDVETDTSSANDGHLQARLDFTPENLRVGEHFRMVDAGDIRDARPYSGGDDDAVEAAPR